MSGQFSRPVTRFMILIAIVAWLALILQLYLMLRNAETNGLTPLLANWNFFSYFTVLTNLLVALSLGFILLGPSSSLSRLFSKTSTHTAIAFYIFIFWLSNKIIIRSISAPTGFQKWVDETLHVIVPLLFVLWWLCFVPKGSLNWIHPFPDGLFIPLRTLYMLYYVENSPASMPTRLLILQNLDTTGFYSMPAGLCWYL
jgi:hypothetical protein